MLEGVNEMWKYYCEKLDYHIKGCVSMFYNVFSQLCLTLTPTLNLTPTLVHHIKL